MEQRIGDCFFMQKKLFFSTLCLEKSRKSFLLFHFNSPMALSSLRVSLINSTNASTASCLWHVFLNYRLFPCIRVDLSRSRSHVPVISIRHFSWTIYNASHYPYFHSPLSERLPALNFSRCFLQIK